MEVPLKGSIRDCSLARILVSLYRNQATGTLSLISSSLIRKIFFHAGDVIFASSTYENDRLGEALLKAGKITVEQYNKSVEMLKTSGKKQGAILVELGYLTPKELFQGVKYQVTEIIYNMFPTENAVYEFVEGQLPEEEFLKLRMNLGNLIYHGVGSIVDQARIRSEMPAMDSVLILNGSSGNLFREIELSDRHREILSFVDGKRTIKEIAGVSFEILKALYVLWATGMIEERDGKAIRDRNSMPEAVRTEEREEYFHSSPAGGKDENAHGTVMVAERLKEGIEEYKRGNFWGAIEKFKEVTLSTPDNAQVWSYLSLAYSRVPGKMKDAEEAILTALKLEPFNVDFHANLGLIYMRAGLTKRARSTFAKALKLDPENEKARKGAEQTQT